MRAEAIDENESFGPKILSRWRSSVCSVKYCPVTKRLKSLKAKTNARNFFLSANSFSLKFRKFWKRSTHDAQFYLIPCGTARRQRRKQRRQQILRCLAVTHSAQAPCRTPDISEVLRMPSAEQPLKCIKRLFKYVCIVEQRRIKN